MFVCMHACMYIICMCSVRIVENELGGSEIFRLISVNIDAERGSARLYWGSGGCAPSGVQGQSPWPGGLGDEVPQKLEIFCKFGSHLNHFKDTNLVECELYQIKNTSVKIT